MKNLRRKTGRGGFTLIELLVVIAIIGILSSVVLASLNTARVKARDAKRIAELDGIQKALQLYSDDNGGTYPTALNDLIAPGYMSIIPIDPQTGVVEYKYAALGTGAVCDGYHLGITLEDLNNPILTSGKNLDLAAGTECTGSAVDFDGDSPIYDVAQ